MHQINFPAIETGKRSNDVHKDIAKVIKCYDMYQVSCINQANKICNLIYSSVTWPIMIPMRSAGENTR